MYFKILSLMFLLIFITKKSHQKNIIVYSNFQVTANPEFISNFSVDWSLHDNNTNEPAKHVEPFSYTVIKDIPILNIQVKVFHTVHGYVSFDQTFNFCAYKRVSKANMFLRMITSEIEKSINFAMKCPFKKGEYKFKRMDIPQFTMPSFVRHTDVFTTSLSLKTKLRGQLQRFLVLSINWKLQEID